MARSGDSVLRIDVWSDIACPWCWVGKRKLEAALAEFDQPRQVAVVWHAFELDPSAPLTRDTPNISYAERLARKYGTSVAGGQEMIDRMTQVAAENGIKMRFDRIHPGNTFDAHRLLQLAKENGLQDALKEQLFRAYLQDGGCIDESDVLARVASEAGIDPNHAQAVLAGDDFKTQVRQDEAKAAALGITGVPFFLFANQYGISGAQPVEALLQLLNRTREELLSKHKTINGAPSCGSDKCRMD